MINRRSQSGSPPVYGGELMPGMVLLTEFLSAVVYVDGTPRTPGTLTVFVGDGCVKVCLNDKDTDESMFKAGPDLPSCLRYLEEALDDPDKQEWRTWKSKKSARK